MKQAAILIVACLAVYASAAHYNYPGSNSDHILRQSSDIKPNGQYSYEYETSNGIYGSESGVGGQYAQGHSQWTAPDGTPIQLSYIADENGYQPSGSHLPTPPPIPPQILRALEYIRTHPPPVVDHYPGSVRPAHRKTTIF